MKFIKKFNEEVGKDYSVNRLTTLKGVPKEVLGSFYTTNTKANSKKFTEKQVVSILVDATMTAMGDEWVPQDDDDFKSFLNKYGLLDTFNEEYN